MAGAVRRLQRRYAETAADDGEAHTLAACCPRQLPRQPPRQPPRRRRRRGCIPTPLLQPQLALSLCRASLDVATVRPPRFPRVIASCHTERRRRRGFSTRGVRRRPMTHCILHRCRSAHFCLHTLGSRAPFPRLPPARHCRRVFSSRRAPRPPVRALPTPPPHTSFDLPTAASRRRCFALPSRCPHPLPRHVRTMSIIQPIIVFLAHIACCYVCCA